MGEKWATTYQAQSQTFDWIKQKLSICPTLLKSLFLISFFLSRIHLLQTRKINGFCKTKQNKALKAPQARGGLPSELAAVDIRSFFERQKCTQLIYGLGDFYDRKKKWKRTCKPIVFSEKNAFDLLTSTMHKRFGKNKT